MLTSASRLVNPFGLTGVGGNRIIELEGAFLCAYSGVLDAFPVEARGGLVIRFPSEFDAQQRRLGHRGGRLDRGALYPSMEHPRGDVPGATPDSMGTAWALRPLAEPDLGHLLAPLSHSPFRGS